MVTIYHEEFLKTADHKIKEINSLNHAGKKVEAAKASLEFAKFKVAYYEQFINVSDPNTNQPPPPPSGSKPTRSNSPK